MVGVTQFRYPAAPPAATSPLSTSAAFRVLATLTLMRGNKPRGELGITAASLRVCCVPGEAEVLTSSRQYRSLFQEPRHSSFIPMQVVVPYAMREKGEKKRTLLPPQLDIACICAAQRGSLGQLRS